MHFVKAGDRFYNLGLVIKVERTPTGKLAVHYAAPGMRHWPDTARAEIEKLYDLASVPGHLVEFLNDTEAGPLLAEVQRRVGPSAGT